VKLAFSFAPDTANPPTAIRGAGVVSVVRSAQGRFTATLSEVWSQCDDAHATLQLAAAAARTAQIGTINLATRTVVIRVIDAAGAEQDVAANANNRVNVELTLRYGSQDY
jgi:hypothetical protein